jgi:hypothetical protein
LLTSNFPSGMAAPSSPLQLGELTLSPSTDTLFQLGELLARTNVAGGLLQPLRLDQVGLTLPVGQWAFKKAEYVTPGAFTPDRAAQQFAEFTDEALRAILGGYARLAYYQLDPLYPGFTDRLLAHLLPGVEIIVPKPRSLTCDMAAVLQAYGTTLKPMTVERLRFAPPRPPLTPPSDEDLLLVALVLFVEQLNLTAWLAHVAACEPTRRLTQVLGGLARGEFFTSEWGGLLPKLLSWVVPRKTVQAQVASSSPLVLVVLAV